MRDQFPTRSTSFCCHCYLSKRLLSLLKNLEASASSLCKSGVDAYVAAKSELEVLLWQSHRAGACKRAAYTNSRYFGGASWNAFFALSLAAQLPSQVSAELTSNACSTTNFRLERVKSRKSISLNCFFDLEGSSAFLEPALRRAVLTNLS